MRRLILFVLLFQWATWGAAQSIAPHPDRLSVAQLQTLTASSYPEEIFTVHDGADATDCSTGSGAYSVPCMSTTTDGISWAWTAIGSGGGSGDITAVGDCTTGACFPSETSRFGFFAPPGGGVPTFRAAVEADISDMAHTTDTGPSPDCSGTSTYQDGEGGCDTVGGDLSGGLDAAVVGDDSHAHTTTTISGILAADMGDADHGEIGWSSSVATVETTHSGSAHHVVFSPAAGISTDHGAGAVSGLSDLAYALCGANGKILATAGGAWTCIDTPAGGVGSASDTELLWNNAGAVDGTSGITWISGVSNALVFAATATQADDLSLWESSAGVDYLAVKPTGDVYLGDGTTDFWYVQHSSGQMFGVFAGGQKYNFASGTFKTQPIIRQQSGQKLININSSGGWADFETGDLELNTSNLWFGADAGDATPENGILHGGENGSGTNIAGSDQYIDGSQGTGTGTGGKVIIRTSPAGTTGSSLNALVDRLTVQADGDVVVGAGDLTVSSGQLFATIPHSEMHTYDSSATTTLTAIDTWYSWSDATCGNEAGGLTCATATDDLTVDALAAGDFQVDWNVSFTLDTNNQSVWFALAVEGVIDTSCVGGRKVGTGADVGSASGGCILSLSSTDSVTLEQLNRSSGGTIITIEHANIRAHRVGS